jgi:hypothetical protein
MSVKVNTRNSEFDNSNLRILIVGTISNAEKLLLKDLKKLSKSFRFTNHLNYMLVESDSTDGTVESLQHIKNTRTNFDYLSLGNLRNNIPDRIERIRFCRNRYVQYIRDKFPEQKWDLVVVADLDGMNQAITMKRVLSSINSPIKWDIVTANQKFGYYDLLALRADGWVEYDIFETLKRVKQSSKIPQYGGHRYIKFLKTFNYYDKFRNSVIYSKMKIIRKKSPWVPVSSSFGGLGIYRPEVLLQFDYTKKIKSDFIHSEHVDLHLKCYEYGFRQYINPYMLNSGFNQYNLNKLKAVRFLREIKKEFFPS